VSYRFNSLPPACRPVGIELGLDSSEDTLPGFSFTRRVRGLSGRVELRLPRYLRRADIVEASAVARGRIRGQEVSVRSQRVSIRLTR